MEQYIIKGGNPLVGEVEIGGAKNAALAILAAAIMTDETVQIDNLPDVNDVNVMLEAIEGIGAMVQRIDRHTVKINGSTIGDFNIEYDYIKKIRASYYLLGALLGKYKRAEVALPGGCNIGSRPIDQHLKGFRALGADVDIEHGKIVAEAEKLRGTHLYFDVVTVGATINVMMAAAMSEGLTIMENVAKEPHVVDVANFLNSMGGFFPFNDKNDATKENSFYRLDRMKTNFCFGMKMELEFKLTEDGKVRMPGEKAGEYIEKPIEFEFSGDDDFLLYIDGKLVLDMAGKHNPLEGHINFETGVLLPRRSFPRSFLRILLTYARSRVR